MKILQPSVEVEPFDGDQMLRNLERAGRTCYKSESKITNTSATNFILNIIKRGHESVLEHEKITVRVICDRGVSHELVRHRIASYSQESTRYVKYKDEIEVIEPCFWDKEKNALLYRRWENAMLMAERSYKNLIDLNVSPQEARTVLPNSLKTEIVVTMNLRSWRNFLKLRCAKPAHPQIRQIAFMILDEFYKAIPAVFNDIKEELT